MKISIVVPCYNMEQYIEKTIQSIINQQYPNLELIIVDGGSTDKTLDILSRYTKYIHLLISEKDEGQYNAINKGLSKATGDVLAWLNADDVYFPWTFEHVSIFFNNYPKQSWISGSTSLMNEKGVINGLNDNIITKPNYFVKNGWFRSGLYGYLQQEGMFWKKELWDKVGGLNENYKLAADFELWTKFSNHSTLVSFGLPLSCFRIRQNSRSNVLRVEYEKEVSLVCKDLVSANMFVKWLGKFSLITMLLVRKFTFSSGLVYFYSLKKKEWILDRKRLSLTVHSLSKLLFLR
jgi:glycosyltransferase involved in cell wall biosynthesis